MSDRRERVVRFKLGKGSQKILNAKAFRIFTFYLFTLHFSLKFAFRIFEVIGKSE